VKGIISTAIAIAVGLVVLAGYFIETPLLVNLRRLLLDWAVILAAVALFVGLANLVKVHSARVRDRQKGGFYSVVLVLCLLATLLAGLALRPEHPVMAAVFNAVQFPVEASLMALLTVSLVYASVRLLRRRRNLLSVIFLVTAVIILLGTAPLPFGEIPILGDLLRPFFTQVLAAAGARGILIGVALGSLATGLRILFGADRPYGSR